MPSYGQFRNYFDPPPPSSYGIRSILPRKYEVEIHIYKYKYFSTDSITSEWECRLHFFSIDVIHQYFFLLHFYFNFINVHINWWSISQFCETENVLTNYIFKKRILSFLKRNHRKKKILSSKN